MTNTAHIICETGNENLSQAPVVTTAFYKGLCCCFCLVCPQVNV